MVITEESLAEMKKDIPACAETLSTEDIAQLVAFTSVKNDEIRYCAFLLLQERSDKYPDVYPYFDVFAEKITSANSYQRSLGIRLIAANAQWDTERKIDSILDDCLMMCDDEKFITARQTIQSIGAWIGKTPEAQGKTARFLMHIDLMKRKDTQRKLLLTDILHILALISEPKCSGEIKAYAASALKSGILDQKSQKEIRKLFDLSV